MLPRRHLRFFGPSALFPRNQFLTFSSSTRAIRPLHTREVESFKIQGSFLLAFSKASYACCVFNIWAFNLRAKLFTGNTLLRWRLDGSHVERLEQAFSLNPKLNLHELAYECQEFELSFCGSRILLCNSIIPFISNLEHGLHSCSNYWELEGWSISP